MIALKKVLCVAVGFLTLLMVPAFAQTQSDYKVHVYEEAALPGFLLQPGSYIFRQPSVSNPDLFEVMKPDGTTVGFVEAIPAQRTDTKYTELDLSAPDATGLRTVQAWYPGGRSDGFEFVYTHKEMRTLDRLARAQNVSSSVAGEP